MTSTRIEQYILSDTNENNEMTLRIWITVITTIVIIHYHTTRSVINYTMTPNNETLALHSAAATKYDAEKSKTKYLTNAEFPDWTYVSFSCNL